MIMTETRPGQPLRPALERAVAMQLAATEYDRVLGLLRSLRPEDWDTPTDCPGWDVRQMAAHLLGMVEMAASIREQNRQNKEAARRLAGNGGEFIDALTGLQVDERVDWTPGQIMEQFANRAPKAVKGRSRAPGFIRRRTMPVKQLIAGQYETWTFGYLIDVILTRDPWMHRVDIARATGAELVVTPDHDGVIVADVVAEWAARHGQPVRLRLAGPAGGEWTFGSGGQLLELDAVDFAATISGRGPATGLLAALVPF